MDSNETHIEKAFDPNSVTLDGDSKTTIDKAEQWVKAPSSIFVTEVGIQIDFNKIHAEKTWEGIIRRCEGDSKAIVSRREF
jgi:hypothetical protein